MKEKKKSSPKSQMMCLLSFGLQRLHHALATTFPDDLMALACTSHFQSETHSVLNQSGIIINSGTSHHFLPDCSKFLNYKEFDNHEPIWAAGGCTFCTLGEGNIQIHLPNGNQKMMLITLKEVYYSPIMVFTLIIKGGICKIRMSKFNVIGHIPQVQELYRVLDGSPSS